MGSTAWRLWVKGHNFEEAEARLACLNQEKMLLKILT
jgi:hypothetical protein